MYKSLAEFMALRRSAESISQNRSKRGGSKNYNKSLCCHYLSLPISVTHSLPPFSLHHTVLVVRCICSFVILCSTPLLSSVGLLTYFSLHSSQCFSMCILLFNNRPDKPEWKPDTQTWGARFCISALFIRTLAHVELRVYVQFKLVF